MLIARAMPNFSRVFICKFQITIHGNKASVASIAAERAVKQPGQQLSSYRLVNDMTMKGKFSPDAKTEYTVIAWLSKQVPGVDGSQVLRTGLHLTQVKRAASPMAIFEMQMMNQTNILV